MLTPERLPAENMDRVMLLSMWFHTLKQEAGVNDESPMSIRYISAGMGRPTFRINPFMVDCFVKYWQGIADLLKKAQSSSRSERLESLALGYCDPRGDPAALEAMSRAMTKWYKVDIKRENILFTVGGAGALRIIFETFNELYADIPHYRVITPFPHYTLYKDNRHRLHPVDVMQEPGYQLTAKALESSIQEAYNLAEEDGNTPKVVLFCNPNNPLGTVISEDELTKIAKVLRAYPHLKVVIDEAYAEMYWGPKIPSLLKLAPDLKERIIILRSATKALSAAGERMAMLMAFDPVLMNQLRAKNIGTIGHAPQSAQQAYAYTMDHFDSTEQRTLMDYYKPKVDYVADRIKQMGAAMPDAHYEVTSTFYVVCDLSDMLGMDIPQGAERALGYRGTIETNEALCYSLLFKKRLMLAPVTYFGMPYENGYMRITCSGQRKELKEMLNRIEDVLYEARAANYQELDTKIKHQIEALKLNASDADRAKYTKIMKIPPNSCAQYKKQNAALSQLSLRLEARLNEQQPALSKILVSKLSFLSPAPAVQRALVSEAQAWEAFIKKTIADPKIRAVFLKVDSKLREEYAPWVEHKNANSEQKVAMGRN